MPFPLNDTFLTAVAITSIMETAKYFPSSSSSVSDFSHFIEGFFSGASDIMTLSEVWLEYFLLYV